MQKDFFAMQQTLQFGNLDNISNTDLDTHNNSTPLIEDVSIFLSTLDTSGVYNDADFTHGSTSSKIPHFGKDGIIE